MEIEVVYERRRGCGYRKPGKNGVGIYLRGIGWGETCERLPYPLEVCPACGGGIKFSRGFTWIRPTTLLHELPLCREVDAGHNTYLPPFPGCPDCHNHQACIVCNPLGDPAGLMWVGEKYYTPASFTAEATEMGISKKVSAIPRGFEMGKHWIYLAHMRAGYTAGIFCVFRPSHVELVIADPEVVPDEAKRLYDRLGEDVCKVVVVREVQEVCHV